MESDMAEKAHRCPWVKDELDAAYHDKEWGVPQHDEQKLFELLILEGMQAGLSWNTVLHKREAMRQAFDGFDPAVMAKYGAEKQAALLQNPALIRNRLKIASLAKNAQAFLRVQKECGSFDAYLWAFVKAEPIDNRPRTASEVPATTPLAEALSKDLKKRGFKFVGPTICYAYMQAVGLVNDHLVGCDFR